MTSIAPERVAGLMLGVMVLYTVETNLPTYCIVGGVEEVVVEVVLMYKLGLFGIGEQGGW